MWGMFLCLHILLNCHSHVGKKNGTTLKMLALCRKRGRSGGDYLPKTLELYASLQYWFCNDLLLRTCFWLKRKTEQENKS